jgi:hypothetical protein
VFSSSYHEPAHAAEVVAPAIETAIEAALAALGIGVAGTVSTPVYKQIIENLKTKAVIDTLGAVTVAQVAGHTIYNVTVPFLQSVASAFSDLYTAITTSESLPNGSYLDNVTEESIKALIGASSSMLISWNGTDPIGADSLYVQHYFPFSGQNTDQIYSINSEWEWYMRSFDSTSYSGRIGLRTHDHSEYLISMDIPTSQAVQGVYLVKYIYGSTAFYAYMFTGIVNGVAAVYGHQLVSDGATGDGDIGEDVINVGSRAFYADGASAINQSADDVIGRVGDAVGVSNPDGSRSIPLNIPDGAEDDIDKARDTDQTQTLGKDITTDADRDLDDDTNTDKDTSPPKPGTLPDLTLPEVIFKDKFPFCLPWDLYIAFSNLAVPPEPPKWTIPFKIQSINFSQDVEIDFSQFSTLASILRWGLSVLFLIWLILLTRQIIGQ